MSRDSVEVIIEGYPTQLEFISNTDFKSLFCAGVGSGKTWAGALKSLEYCIANPGAVGMVTAPTYTILNDATIPAYLAVFPQWLVKKFITRPYPRLTLNNGCVINFRSTHKPEMIAGVTVAFAHMDEASLSVYQAFVNTRERIRQVDKENKPYPHQIWCTTTPRQLNWLYHEVIDKDDPITIFTAATSDNIFLSDVEGYILRTGIKVGTKEYEQEILGHFVSLTGECLFDDTTLERALRETPETIDVREDGHLYIWREYVVGAKYVAAMDCSDEGGEGVNDLIIIDSQTGIEMAEINIDNRADAFAEMGFNLLEEYSFPLLAVERNGTAGGMVLQKLIDLGYKNLYKDDKDREGWYTYPNAIPPKVGRHTMLLNYEEAVRTRQTIPASSDAIGEMSTFVQNDKGKYEHRVGCKDDRVMARAICWQMTKEKVKGKSQFMCLKRLATSYA